MTRSRLRGPLMLVATITTAAFAVLPGSTVAIASHDGTEFVLTSSDGSTTISFDGGPPLTSTETITDAVWSPDGSRAVFVNADGAIMTVRHDDGTQVATVVEATPGVERRHPTWTANGMAPAYTSFEIAWSEKPAPDQPWRLMSTDRSAPVPGQRVVQISPDDGMNYTHPDGGPNGLIVFQRQADNAGTPTGSTEVWLYDPAAGTTPETRISQVITKAGNPAISPDDDLLTVAFVKSDGTNDQIGVIDVDSGTAIQLTSDATDHDDPEWSPDGLTIAFGTSTGLATVPADGSGSPTPVSGLFGVPAYQRWSEDHVVRLYGSDRFGTAIATSIAAWATADNAIDSRPDADSVVLSRSDLFADALGGSALAAAKRGPLLLTPPTSLHAGTKAEIQRVLGSTDPATKTVYVLGSVAAISQPVEDEIAALGYTTVRLQGPSRFETALAIADAIDETPDIFLAATGLNFPDALAAGAAAGSYNVAGGPTAVVVLTSDTTLPVVVADYLDQKASGPDAHVYGVGNQAATAVAPYGGIPLAGGNRYETALLTADYFFGGEVAAGVATGANWPDALAGGALMGTIGGPLLLTGSGSTLDANTASHLSAASGEIVGGIIFGSTGVVNAAINDQVGGLISGPDGFDVQENPNPDIGAK